MGGSANVNGKSIQSTDNFLVAPMYMECVIVDDKDGTKLCQMIEWPTCEHFFQASKFDSQTCPSSRVHCRRIQHCNSAMDAWSLGQSRKCPLRGDWEAVKAHAMYLAVRAKYDQHNDYASEFAHTNGAIQARQSTSNWQELNSIVLERVRYELREQLNLEPAVTRNQYDDWCRATDLPKGSTPVVVYMAPIMNDKLAGAS